MLAEVSMAKITDFGEEGTGTFSSREGWSRRATMRVIAEMRRSSRKMLRRGLSERAERHWNQAAEASIATASAMIQWMGMAGSKITVCRRCGVGI